MIKHKVTKTTTATTPPIKAWSVPCCPTAFGSDETQRRETKRADEGVSWWGEGVRAEEQQKTDNTKQSEEEKDDYFQLVPALMSCCHSSLLSHHAVGAELPSSLRIIKWERGRARERKRRTPHWHKEQLQADTHSSCKMKGKKNERGTRNKGVNNSGSPPPCRRSPQHANRGGGGRVVHSK